MELISVVVLGAIFYMFPALIAETQGHREQRHITKVNTLWGWTGIVWIICLAWALKE
jgi:hypothetical protein